MAIYLKYLLKAPRSNITRYYALYEQLMDGGLCCSPVTCLVCGLRAGAGAAVTGHWSMKTEAHISLISVPCSHTVVTL